MTAAGWGANQFAPMLLVYRDVHGVSEQLVTGMFAAYVGGLVPALLAAAWASQHYGKTLMVRIAMVLMLVGTVLLYLGATSDALLFAGRVLHGIGIGFVMSPGTAWIKELSASERVGTGARRSTIALTAGFALGAAVTGLLAQWLPDPMHLPYVVHVALQLAAAVAVWTVPELDAADHPTPSIRAVVEHVRAPWFLRLVLPAAPWVFGAATVSFAVVPSIVGPLPGLPHVLAAGLMAGLTLGTSVAVQPHVRRFAEHDPGRVLPVGMGALAVGMVLATASGLWPSPWWLPPVALIMGVAHGLLMVGCLTIVEHHTPVHLMAPTSAIVYALTYIGFTAPYWVSLWSLIVPGWTVLAAGAGVALATLAWLWFERRDA